MRSSTVDTTRMLAMLLVVAGHSTWLSKNLPDTHRFIYLFHMPVFFFISGYVYKSKSITSTIRNRAERLLIPFIFVSTIATIYYITTKRPFSVDNPWFGLMWGTGHSLPWTTLWFLPTLFITTVGFCIFLTILKEKHKYWLLLFPIIAITIQGFLVSHQYENNWVDNFGRPIGWPWGLDILPICLFYFWCGYFFSAKSFINTSKTTSHLVIVASAIIFTSIFYSGASLDLNYRRFSTFYASTAASFFGVIFIFLLSQKLAESKLISKAADGFNEHIMMIFILHSPIQAAALRSLPENSSISAILAFSTSIAIPIVINNVFVKKYWALGLLFGGKKNA